MEKTNQENVFEQKKKKPALKFNPGLELTGFYLGFVVLEMNMCWNAIWCILRHNFEKCHSVCTNLVASGWFFPIWLLIYCNDNNIFGGEAGHCWGGGGEASTPQIS